MTMANMFVNTLLPLLLVAVVSAEIPSYIHICGRRDPQLDQCIINSLEAMNDKLRDGIPELDVPASEPVTIDHVTIADFDNFKAFAENIKVHGLSNYKLKYLHVDLDTMTIYIKSNYPKVEMDADYDINTRILVPVVGKGPIHLSSNDIDANVTIKYQLVDRKGKQYMFISSVTTLLTINDFQARFDDPDNTQAALATAINAALENTRQDIIERTKPNVEKAVSKMVIDISNKICKHFTYDELFPDRV